MITARRALLQKLRTLTPALADNDIVPGLTHFLFTGDESWPAMNGASPCRCRKPATTKASCRRCCWRCGAARQRPRCRSRPTGERVARVTLGASVTCLPTQPLEHYRFQMPRQMPQHRVSRGVPARHRAVLPAMGQQLRHRPDQLGVTLIPRRRDLRLFALIARRSRHARVAITVPATVPATSA